MSYRHIHVQAEDWQGACDAVARALGTDSAGRLAFVYLGHQLAADADRIVERLRRATGIGHWVGSVGAGICSTGLEVYDRPSLAVMATDLDEEAFRIMTPVRGTADDFLAATRGWRERTLASVAIVHGDPNAMHLAQTIEALADGLGDGFLIGGLTSAPGGHQVQIADRAVDGGLSGVLLAGSVALSTGLSQGCSLIGEPHVVTDCRRNIALSIDDRPALEVLKKDIGAILSRNLERLGGYIFAALPVPASDTGDYLVRNLLGVDPEGGMVAIGDLLEPGMRIQFARRDPQTARADLEHMVGRLRDRIHGAPRGALYHTCIGRGRNQFGDHSAELEMIRGLLGDVPLVGFYANGEICHRRLYGYTGVLTVFHER